MIWVNEVAELMHHDIFDTSVTIPFGANEMPIVSLYFEFGTLKSARDIYQIRDINDVKKQLQSPFLLAAILIVIAEFHHKL